MKHQFTDCKPDLSECVRHDIDGQWRSQTFGHARALREQAT